MKAYLLIGFFALVLLGVPLSFALGIIGTGGLLILNKFPLSLIAQRLFTGVDSFSFMAIPFFILAGNLMSKAQITDGLVKFSNALVGHLRGGLAHVNVLNSMFFAGISGSAAADVAAMGNIEITMMEKGGYDRSFAAALTAASSVVGPIIPPSINMVVYAIAAGNVSVTAMFLAGFLPGICLGIGMMIVGYFISRRRNYPVTGRRSSLKEMWHAFVEAIPALLMPLLLLGGMLSGVFTATEASAVSALYALLAGVFYFKTLKWKDIKDVLLDSAQTSAAVFLLIGAASIMTWLLTALQIPQAIAQFFINVSPNKYIFLLFVNLLLMVTGSLLDVTPAMLILVPILSPAATYFGVDPVHFGIIFVVNLCVGLITPPVGTCLFLTCNVAKIKMTTLVRQLWPFIAVEFVVLMILTYLPDFVMFLPKLFGY